MLRLEMLNASRLPFRLLDFWNPLLVLGTLDPEFQVPHGPARWLDEVSTQLHIPFSPYLAAVRITDLESGADLGTVDVSPAIDKFCAEHPQDNECRIRNEQPKFSYLPMIRSK